MNGAKCFQDLVVESNPVKQQILLELETLVNNGNLYIHLEFLLKL